MFETLTEWRSIVQWLLTGFVAWVWWSLKSRFTTKENHEDLEKRLSAVEAKLHNLPSIKDHHELIVKLTEMNGYIGKISTIIDSVQKQVDRVEDYLNRGSRE